MPGAEVRPVQSEPNILELCRTYSRLNGRRLIADQRAVSMASDARARDGLLEEVALILAELRAVIGQLAESHSTDVVELRAKATVLASLLASGDIIPQNECLALARSLADDTVACL